jgi:hypothetical protein
VTQASGCIPTAEKRNPARAGGVWTLFSKLGSLACQLLVSAPPVQPQSMPRWEIPLARGRPAHYVVHRSNATRVALSAFLDVSSLNLAVPLCTAFFLCRHTRPLNEAALLSLVLSTTVQSRRSAGAESGTLNGTLCQVVIHRIIY